MWSHRNVSGSNEVCHACAQAAFVALAAGQNPQDAAKRAARFRHGPGWETPASSYARAYAEWFDWARKHLGNSVEGHHRAAAAAMETLEAGGDTHAGADAAQRAADAHMSESLAQAEADAPGQSTAPAPQHPGPPAA